MITNLQYLTPGRLVATLLVMLLFAGTALAQEEGDRLIGEDDDIQIYRSEDGTIKIKREDAEEGTWIAELNPDGEKHINIFKTKGEGTFEFEEGMDDVGAVVGKHVVVVKSEDGENFSVMVDGEEADLADVQKRVMMFKSDDGEEHSFAMPQMRRYMLKGGEGENMKDVFMWRGDNEPLVSAHGMRARIFDGLDGDSPMLWVHGELEQQQKISEQEQQSRKLAREIKDAEAGERADLEVELEALLGEIFDLKQDARVSEIERLQERIEKLRVTSDEREANRSEVIERRKSTLLGDRDPLEW